MGSILINRDTVLSLLNARSLITDTMELGGKTYTNVDCHDLGAAPLRPMQ